MYFILNVEVGAPVTYLRFAFELPDLQNWVIIVVMNGNGLLALLDKRVGRRSRDIVIRAIGDRRARFRHNVTRRIILEV